MDRQKDERVRRVTITYDTKVLSTDGAIHQLLLEVGGIPDRELETMRQEAEHLEKSPFAITFHESASEHCIVF